MHAERNPENPEEQGEEGEGTSQGDNLMMRKMRLVRFACTCLSCLGPLRLVPAGQRGPTAAEEREAEII